MGPSDRALIEKASDHLHREVAKKLQYSLIEKNQVSHFLQMLEERDSQCSSVVCVTNVGRRVGADWVIAGEVTKISTLIWLVSARLIDVKNTKVLRQETLELKGNFADLIPPAIASLSRLISDGE